MPTTVSVVICTFRRPALLPAAVRTARAQRLPPGVTAEVIVVDNAPEGCAREIVATLAREPGPALHYLALPTPNIAAARNLGVAHGDSEFVAFLDDDEWCEPGWIAALVRTAQDTEADVAMGAVLADFPDGPPDWDPSGHRYQRRIALGSGAPIGIRHDPRLSGRWLGTGNSLFRRVTCLMGPAPFDEAIGRTGGEDTDLLHRLDRQGRRIVWCPDAVVHEIVPGERATFAYFRRRSFRTAGQGAAIAIGRARSPALAAVTVTAKAAAQTAWRAAALILGPRSPQARLDLAQSCGKLLWWYGRGHS